MRILSTAEHYCRAIWESLKRFSGSTLLEEVTRIHEEVCLLTMEEARSLALTALRNTQRFQVIESPPGAEEMGVLKELAPQLRALFMEYASICHVFSDTKYIRRNMGPSQLRAGFLRIATSIDHTELVVRPGEECVYEIDGSEGSEAPIEGMPSVFHQIVFEERLTAEN